MTFPLKGDLVRINVECIDATSRLETELFDAEYPTSEFYILVRGSYLIYTGVSREYSIEGYSSFDELDSDILIENFVGLQFICLTHNKMLWLVASADECLFEYVEGNPNSFETWKYQKHPVDHVLKLVCRPTNDS